MHCNEHIISTEWTERSQSWNLISSHHLCLSLCLHICLSYKICLYRMDKQRAHTAYYPLAAIRLMKKGKIISILIFCLDTQNHFTEYNASSFSLLHNDALLFLYLEVLHCYIFLTHKTEEHLNLVISCQERASQLSADTQINVCHVIKQSVLSIWHLFTWCISIKMDPLQISKLVPQSLIKQFWICEVKEIQISLTKWFYNIAIYFALRLESHLLYEISKMCTYYILIICFTM